MAEYDSLIPANIPDPTASAPTDADLASILGYSPPAAPQASGPVIDPAQDPGVSSFAPTQPAQPLSKTGVNVATGAKVGVEGYNPAAYAAIQRGPQSATEKKIAADRAEVGQQFAPIQREEHAAADTAMQATLDAGRLESQKAAIAAEAHTKIANANLDFEAKERAAMENARAESQTNFANYKAAMLDYNASQINPSQLWDNAGKAGQFGMVVTAFIHDFLGAKGIQTSGLESLNNAIKTNINVQLDNMRKKLDVAQGFKQLWEMQRLQSATDAEARARMNGFYLSAIQNQIDAQLGAYDSQLALVKAQAAKAAVQKEMAKSDLEVQKHIDDAANQRATNRVHMYAAELQASSSKYSADAHVKAAEIAAQNKNLVSPLAGVIFDTSLSGGGKAARRLLPDIKPEEGVKIRQQASNVFNTVSNIEKLIDLQDRISKAPPDIGVAALKKLQSEEARTAELVRNVTKMGIIYDNSGKQINEQEVKLYDEIVGKKDWWLNGDNIRTLGTLAKTILDKENSLLQGVSTEIVPGDPAYGAKSGNTPLDPGNSALTDIQSQPGAGRHQNTEAENAVKQITSPDASKDAFPDRSFYDSHEAESARKNKVGFESTLGQLDKFLGFGDPWANPHTGAGLPNDEAIGRQLFRHFIEDNKGVPSLPEQPTKSFMGVVKLGDLAQSGDPQAKTELETMAKTGKGLVSYYANWELSQINKPSPVEAKFRVVPGPSGIIEKLE